MGDEKEEQRLGRVYPFCYKQWHDESEESLSNLLRTFDDRAIWLLDIRFNPEDSWAGFQGSWLKKVRPTQYRHAKGLGLVNEQLFHSDAAVRKILELVQAGESFVLFSGALSHVRMVETLVRSAAEAQNILLEDPYAFHAGDLCLWMERDTGHPIEVILHHRTPDVHTFLASSLKPGYRNEYVDIRDLTVKTLGAYRCEKCERGVASVTWREEPQQKLCKHCFWVWELEYGEE